MAKEPRSRLDRIFGGPVPDDETVSPDIAAALTSMSEAHSDTIIRVEHELTVAYAQIEQLKHNQAELLAALELAEAEIVKRDTRIAELDKVAFPTMPLPDALQAELLLDLTDQPPAPKTPVTYPETVEWVDVVGPSSNGTS